MIVSNFFWMIILFINNLCFAILEKSFLDMSIVFHNKMLYSRDLKRLAEYSLFYQIYDDRLAKYSLLYI
jgi:hypothetical protein